MDRQERLLKTVAAAFGADVEPPKTPGSPAEGSNVKIGPDGQVIPASIKNEQDAKALPFGLGYEKI